MRAYSLLLLRALPTVVVDGGAFGDGGDDDIDMRALRADKRTTSGTTWPKVGPLFPRFGKGYWTGTHKPLARSPQTKAQNQSSPNSVGICNPRPALWLVSSFAGTRVDSALKLHITHQHICLLTLLRICGVTTRRMGGGGGDLAPDAGAPRLTPSSPSPHHDDDQTCENMKGIPSSRSRRSAIPTTHT